MQIVFHSSNGPMVRQNGTVFVVDVDGVFVHEAMQPLELGTNGDRKIAAAIRQLVEAAEVLERAGWPSAASLLGGDGAPVRTDHGMLYID